VGQEILIPHAISNTILDDATEQTTCFANGFSDGYVGRLLRPKKNKGNVCATLQGMLCRVVFSIIFPAEAKLTILEPEHLSHVPEHLSHVHEPARDKDIMSF
jgi:hypothetical protein